MHGGQNAGADQEGSQQRQREGENRQQHGPHFEGAALLGHRQRVHQRRAGQPRHEGGVFDRVPEPPPSPAQRVIGPRTAQANAQRQERPGNRGPGTRPARPGCVQIAPQQRSDRKCESHGETDVAHVQHRWMGDHAEILQQRVQIAPLFRGRDQPLERARRQQDEQQESDADQTHHAQDPRHHRLRQMAAEHADGEHPEAQDQQPQQHRPFMAAPERGDLVAQRQRARRIGRHVYDRKVVAHK